MDELTRVQLMRYFIVATLHLYRDNLQAVRGPQSPEQFIDRNRGVIERMKLEARLIFHFQLDHGIIHDGVSAYIAGSRSVMHQAARTSI